MQITMKRQMQIEAERTADRAARFAAMSERELVAYIAKLTDKLGDRSIDYRVLVNVPELIAAARGELALTRNRSGERAAPIGPDELAETMP